MGMCALLLLVVLEALPWLQGSRWCAQVEQPSHPLQNSLSFVGTATGPSPAEAVGMKGEFGLGPWRWLRVLSPQLWTRLCL